MIVAVFFLGACGEDPRRAVVGQGDSGPGLGSLDGIERDSAEDALSAAGGATDVREIGDKEGAVEAATDAEPLIAPDAADDAAIAPESDTAIDAEDGPVDAAGQDADSDAADGGIADLGIPDLDAPSDAGLGDAALADLAPDVALVDTSPLDTAVADTVDAFVDDTGDTADTAPPDTADTFAPETTPADTVVDDTFVAAPPDTADTADTAETTPDTDDTTDTYAADTYVADTYVADTYVADTYVADTYVADTYVADTYVADTYVADTAADTADTTPADSAGDTSGATDTFVGPGCFVDPSPGHQTFTCGDITYDVEIPEICASEACGLVLDIHGFSMTADLEDGNTQMRSRGQAEGFIVIQPTAPKVAGIPTWDLAVHAEPIFELTREVAVVAATDPARAYVMGYSQGGALTWQLVCAHADFFAAAAPLAALPGCAFSAAEAPSEEVDMVVTHGTADTVVAFALYQGQRDDALAFWPLGAPSVIEQDGAHLAERRTTPSGTVFETWEHDYTSTSFILNGHCFPGSPLRSAFPFPFGCQQLGTFSYADVAFAFFKAHPR